MNFSKTSFLFSSSNPYQLSKFYSVLKGVNASEGISSNDFSIESDDSCNIKFFKPTSDLNNGRLPPPVLSLCFEKEPSLNPLKSIKGWIEEVILVGGRLIDGPRLEYFGAEAWMSDQEENKFLLYVPLLVSREIK